MKNLKYIILLMAVLTISSCGGKGRSGEKEKGGADSVQVPEFSADSAMAHIEKQCSFGPRVLGSKAHADCADYIVEAFQRMGCQVERQETTFRLYNGQTYEGCNIIASHNAEASQRIMLCAHWDSRPWADADPDPKNHKTPVMAANDGASGVAVLLEVARQMQKEMPSVGVDFVCFDAEDAGVPDWDTSFQGSMEEDEASWCLGSQYWARNPHRVDFEFAILLDMVGGKGSTFYKEQFSNYYAPGVVARVWDAAHEAGYSSFFPLDENKGGAITDDHLPINRIAGIAAIDIIAHYPDQSPGFCPTWHTINDTPDNIDPQSLKAVGQTLLQLIYNM